MPDYIITEVPKSGNVEKVNKGYEILKESAKFGKYIKYSHFYSKLGLSTENPQDRNLGAAVLADISIYTYKKCKCLLSSIVMVVEKNEPGKGYFQLAKELGAITEDTPKDEYHDFWVKQISECFDKALKDEI